MFSPIVIFIFQLLLSLSIFRSERDIPSLAYQNIQVMQPANKVEDAEATNLSHTSFKSDVNIKPKKRQPVTKAEVITFFQMNFHSIVTNSFFFLCGLSSRVRLFVCSSPLIVTK